MLTRIATWLDSVVTAVVAVALRATTALAAFVMRRGKHRAWRRHARQRSEGSRV